MKNNRPSNSAKLWIVLIILLFVGFGFWGVHYLSDREDATRTSGLVDAPVERLMLEDNGTRYILRDDITTYLFLGTDETLDSSFQYEDRNLNNKQADLIALMVIDRTNETYTALHLNRDTYMEIRKLDNNGNPDGYITAHLNNAHSYGSGGKDSCRNVAEAVSRLLYGVPIDHYLAITMDGIPVLADLVGGVPVTVDKALVQMYPSLVEGDTELLTGDMALKYVRARSSVTDGSNLSRMERQRTFMESYYTQMESKLQNDDAFSIKFADALSPYITSDLTTNELSNFANQLKDYQFLSIEDTAGDAIYNPDTRYNEFYVDMTALKKQVINLFFAAVT